MQLERGKFLDAEMLLKAAVCDLPAPTVTASGDTRIDSVYMELQLKLARVCLDSHTIEKGLEILEKLAGAVLPHGQEANVHVLLAEVHITQHTQHTTQHIAYCMHSTIRTRHTAHHTCRAT